MSWVRLDDQFTDHPKVIAAGPLAAWLFVCGLAYCARYLTDGFIPVGQVRKLADLDDSARLVTALLTAGMWESVEGGYRIHDYLDYQPSAGQVKADRAKAAQRQASWRGRRHGNAESNAVTNAAPVPVPIPRDPERETRAREGDDMSDAKATSLSLVASQNPSETAEPEPARQEPHTAGEPPPSDPKASRMTERALFDSWCIAVGVMPKGSQRRAWVEKLAEMHRDYGLSPPDVPRLVGQYRAKMGADRNPTPGQVAGLYTDLGVSPYATAAAAYAGRTPDVAHGDHAAGGESAEALAERKRAALAQFGVPIPARALPAPGGNGAIPRPADTSPG